VGVEGEPRGVLAAPWLLLLTFESMCCNSAAEALCHEGRRFANGDGMQFLVTSWACRRLTGLLDLYNIMYNYLCILFNFCIKNIGIPWNTGDRNTPSSTHGWSL
jgi:hypothetical protein